jgi:hypothetical protein
MQHLANCKSSSHSETRSLVVIEEYGYVSTAAWHVSEILLDAKAVIFFPTADRLIDRDYVLRMFIVPYRCPIN